MTKPFLAIVKNRNFLLLWLGQITSQIALNMLYFVLAIQVYDITRSNIAVSVLLLAFGLPAIIFGVLAGGIVDYFDKRSVLVFCNITRIFLLFLFFIFARHLPILYLLSIVISILTQLFIPAEGPSIPRLVENSQLLAANSLFTTSFYLSTVLGFILAGPFMRIFGDRNIYLIMIILMLLAFYFVYKLPRITEKKKFTLTLPFITETINGGIKFIRSNQRIEQSLILMTFAQALIATLSVLAPGFADKVLKIDLVDASYLVMGPAALGLVLGALWVGSYGNKFLKGKIILVGILSSGVDLILLSLVSSATKPIFFIINNLFLAIILLFLLGIFNSFISVPANTILQEDSDSDMRGRVYGVLTALTSGVSFLPVVFSGILADAFGVNRALTILGIIIMGASFYHYWQKKRTVTIYNS